MVKNYLVAAKGNKTPDPPIDNNIRLAWNKYTDWLASRGLKGHPSLDKDDLGGKMIDQYRKENPTTPITRELIPTIQKEFSKYRDWSLNEVKEGRAGLSPGVTADNYMKWLSIVDGIPGQRTTSFKFPSSYLQTFDNGKFVGVEDKGFSTTKL